MYTIDFHKPIHIHFIGIGGISMSGLAEILLQEGFTISGSDAKESELTKHLTAKGAQIFYGTNNENSGILAENIRQSIVNALQPQNKRTLKKGTKDTYLLIGAKTPAVIVECGFMSNDAELKCLLDEEYQNKMAFAVYCGIMNYLLKE